MQLQGHAKDAPYGACKHTHDRCINKIHDHCCKGLAIGSSKSAPGTIVVPTPVFWGAFQLDSTK